MKFRNKIKISKIQIGKRYYVDFVDPHGEDANFKGYYKVEAIMHGEGGNYYSKDWFYGKILNNYGKFRKRNTPLYVDKKAFKYEIS